MRLRGVAHTISSGGNSLLRQLGIAKISMGNTLWILCIASQQQTNARLILSETSIKRVDREQLYLSIERAIDRA